MTHVVETMFLSNDKKKNDLLIITRMYYTQWFYKNTEMWAISLIFIKNLLCLSITQLKNIRI